MAAAVKRCGRMTVPPEDGIGKVQGPRPGEPRGATRGAGGGACKPRDLRPENATPPRSGRGGVVATGAYMGLGSRMAKVPVAECSSTAKRPTFGMSVAGILIFMPSRSADFTVTSAFFTLT